jgi:glycerol-3-phosphate acyltransferase PlsY
LKTRAYQLLYAYCIEIAVAISIAYLLGSISSAILVCTLMHLPDPRTQGSHNPGATNVLRIGGKKAAIITLFGDVLKGFVPVLLARGMHLNAAVLACVALAAFIGHLFPLFFQFKGGKGVATLLGCLLALNPLIGLGWIATWLIMALLFRYSSLASLTASLLTPIYFWYFSSHFIYVIVSLFMALLLVYRHRGNIINLWAGKESKIGTRRHSNSIKA